MDSPTIIALGSLVVSGFSAIAALWSVRHASQANLRAAEANEISQEALEHQKLHAPPPWSQIEVVAENKYQLRNLSGRDICVVEVIALPSEAQSELTAFDLPRFVSYGDTYNFLVESSIAYPVSAVDIHWYFVDESDDIQITHRNL